MLRLPSLFLATCWFLTLLCAQGSVLHAQIKQGDEIGIVAGGAYSFTDINNTARHVKQAREGAGLFYRHNFHPRWSLRTGLNYSYLQGSDSESELIFESRRNLSYRNKAWDAYGQIEFNFLDKPRRSRFGEFHHFTPFLAIGAALVYHNPQAYYNGEWVDLRPLGTEGQNFAEVGDFPTPYRRIAIAVPITGGIKYYAAKHWAFGLEFTFRKTFTDYLDDVSGVYVDRSVLLAGSQGNLAAALADRSIEMDMPAIGVPGRQRGDAARNDAYAFCGISISYVFASMVCPPPGRGRF